uniref:NifU-like protein 3ic n=1 Tax=Rhizophora mucronata TaxID=61149 RepID=A0A2P2KRY7_RHIMU
MSALSTQPHGVKATSSAASILGLPLPSSKSTHFLSFRNDFLRRKYLSRHFLQLKFNRRPRKRAGFVVSPSCVLPLTEENVERVLDEVRPGLMADGGNVALSEIDGLVVVLKLQGACGSCPSSTMTLKMGIETRLRDKIPEIMAVEQILDTETGLELNEENVDKVTKLEVLIDSGVAFVGVCVFHAHICSASAAKCIHEAFEVLHSDFES